MANTLLTPDMITRQALIVLHQKANFLTNINTAYDSSFAKTGAKIGDTLRIRLPNQYTTFSGPTLAIQDVTEISVTLPVQSQKGIGMAFTSADLTMKIDDFTDIFIDPAVSQLVATVENDACSMIEQVYNVVDVTNSSLAWGNVLDARVKLLSGLTPVDGKWAAILRLQDSRDLVNSNKGLFQSSSEIARQYEEGMMGMSAGFKFYENTHMPTHTSGTTSAAPTNWTITSTISGSDATPFGTLTADTTIVYNGTLVAGDVISISGVTWVNPETKVDTGVTAQFAVAAAVAAGTTKTISLIPPIYIQGPRQNVTLANVITSSTVAKIGTPSYVYKSSAFFHKDAFTFATADLVLPDGVDFKSRQVKEGVSMRLVRQYDVFYDRIATRLDVLYGYKAIRPILAARTLTG